MNLTITCRLIDTPVTTPFSSSSSTSNFLPILCALSFTAVLLAGTNDLKRSDVSPSSLIDELSGHIDTLNDIGNIDNIFVCKIPPRLDSSKINDKVRLYNNKLCVRFRDSIKIIECIPSEMKLFYKDGLHFSNLGLKRQSGIILSSLYDDLAPELKRKKSSNLFGRVEQGSIHFTKYWLLECSIFQNSSALLSFNY